MLQVGQSKNTFFLLKIPSVHPYTSLKQLFLAEHSSWILWLPVAFALGIITYFNLAHEPSFAYSALGTLFSLACCIALRQRPGAYWLFLYLCFFCAGSMVAQARTIACHAPVLTKRIGPVALTAKIESVELTPTARRITLKPIAISGLSPNQTPRYIRLHNVPDLGVLRAGDTVSTRVILYPFQKPTVPGGYSFKRDAYFKQMGASGFALSPLTLVEAAQTHSLIQHIEQLRHTITDQLFAYMPASEASIAAALLVGDQGAIRHHDFEIMRDSGLAHLLSVSGMHLTQVAFIIFFICRIVLASFPYLALHHPIKQWSALAAILGSLVYLILTDMPVPAVRAFMMTSLVLMAILLDRHATPLRSIAFTALAILCVRPEAVLSASFQMSFAAVIALVSCFEGISPYLSPPTAYLSLFRRILHPVLMLTISSLVAGMATAPFTLYHFHQLSTLGLVANMVAIPLSSFFIMPLALLSVIGMIIQLPALPFYLLHYSITLLLAWADIIAHLPYASIRIWSITGTSLALCSIGGLWLCLWQTRLRWLGMLALLAGMLVNIYPHPVPDLLIDEKGKIFAFRNSKDQLVFFPKKPSAYIQEQWQAATKTHEVTDITHAEKDPHFRCDIIGCIVEKDEKQIAINFQPCTLRYDCYHADAVVNLTHSHLFCPKQAINSWQLWKYGTHSVEIGDSIVIRSAEARPTSRQIRPWE